MLDPETLTEGVSRTHEIAKWAVFGLMLGVGMVAGLALFAPRFRRPATQKRVTQMRVNYLGQPLVDDGGCADIP